MDNICLGCLDTIEEQAGPDHLLPNLIQDPDPVEVLRWLRRCAVLMGEMNDPLQEMKHLLRVFLSPDPSKY
ncbi:hypothetical protein BGZ89_005263 [Linnemannia elongata]|nr:hypothetical protein BGZ89_005263 [Linnemannia elongata]